MKNAEASNTTDPPSCTENRNSLISAQDTWPQAPSSHLVPTEPSGTQQWLGDFSTVLGEGEGFVSDKNVNAVLKRYAREVLDMCLTWTLNKRSPSVFIAVTLITTDHLFTVGQVRAGHFILTGTLSEYLCHFLPLIPFLRTVPTPPD